MRGKFGRRFAPVNVGDEVDVEIESTGSKGDGVAKVKGFVIFVPGTKKGDKVRIRITKVFRSVGFGEVVERKTEEAEPEESETFGEETEKEVF